MKHKTVAVDCTIATARQLALILRTFAHAAYPDGGSECAQVARETLNAAAAACESHTGGPLLLRRRLLPQLRAALRWYVSEHDMALVESAQDLASLLSRNNKGV